MKDFRIEFTNERIIPFEMQHYGTNSQICASTVKQTTSSTTLIIHVTIAVHPHKYCICAGLVYIFLQQLVGSSYTSLL